MNKKEFEARGIVNIFVDIVASKKSEIKKMCECLDGSITRHVGLRINWIRTWVNWVLKNLQPKE